MTAPVRKSHSLLCVLEERTFYVSDISVLSRIAQATNIWPWCLLPSGFSGESRVGSKLQFPTSKSSFCAWFSGWCYCLLAKSHLTLCDSKDCRPSHSSVYGILQARVLEWVAIFFSKGSSQSRDQTGSSALAGGFLCP